MEVFNKISSREYNVFIENLLVKILLFEKIYIVFGRNV
jgi:hypothetical protein